MERLIARLKSMSRLELGAVGVLAVCAVLLVVSIAMMSAARANLATIGANHDDAKLVNADYMQMNAKLKRLEGKIGAVPDVAGVVSAVDRLLAPIGLKDKLKSQRNLPAVDPTDEKAELVFEGLTMNELVNLIYNVDDAPYLLVIRSAEMKTNFQDPQLLDLVMSVSFIKPDVKK